VCELARQQIEVDVENAVQHYELALELDENLYEAAQDAGMCHYAAGNMDPEEREDRLDEAEDLFRRAIELRPTAGLSWWSLARVLNDRGDAAGCEAVLHQFLAEQPEGTERDLVENALVHGFQEDSASDEQVRFQQAQAMAFGGQPVEAVELLRPLAEVHPDVVEIWFVLGAACRRAGDSAEAERCLRRAARLAPGEPFIWWELGRAYMEMSQWKPAEDALRKALEADPENAQYLADLGRVLLKQGDREGARDAVDRAQELVPDDPEVVAAAEELARA
jgi:Flp pilus assembly protein TadD